MSGTESSVVDPATKTITIKPNDAVKVSGA